MFGKKSKYFFTAGIILMFVVMIFGLFFMTQYANVHVFYNIKNGEVEINRLSLLTIGGKEYSSNQYLFDYYRYSTDFPELTTVKQIGEYLRVVYDFQMKASRFNDTIIIYFVVGLICVAGLFLFDNHKRNIYYISNLVFGIIFPSIMMIFSIIMISNDLSLISNFEKNKETYQITSVMQDTSITGQERSAFIETGVDAVYEKASNVNAATMYVALALFGIVAAYFTFIMVFSILKYTKTSKARKEVIERAVNAND